MLSKVPHIARHLSRNRPLCAAFYTTGSRFFGVSHNDLLEHKRIAEHLRTKRHEEPAIQALFIELPHTLHEAFVKFNRDKDISALKIVIARDREVAYWQPVEKVLIATAEQKIPIFPVDAYLSPEESKEVRTQPVNTGSLSPVLQKRLYTGNATMLNKINEVTKKEGIETFAVLAGAAHFDIAKILGIKPVLSKASIAALTKLGMRVYLGEEHTI